CLRQRITESYDMCSAFRGCYIIYKSVCVVTVGIIVLHRHFHIYVVFHAFAVYDLIIQRRLALIQISDEFFDTSLIVEGMFAKLLSSPVAKYDAQTLSEERHLAKTLFQCIIVKYSLFENLFIRKECNLCSCPVSLTLSHCLQLIADISSLIALF